MKIWARIFLVVAALLAGTALAVGGEAWLKSVSETSPSAESAGENLGKGGISIEPVPHPCECPPGANCIPTPRVGFIAPTAGEVFRVGESSTINVFACDLFALGGQSTGDDPTSLTVVCPGINLETSDKSIQITPTLPGTCELLVVAGDMPMRAKSSSVEARLSIPVVSAAPSVAFTGPTPDRVIPEGNLVQLSATATDSDGSVVSVTFEVRNRNTQALIFTQVDSTFPYGANLPWTAPGDYVATARALDNDGNTSEASVQFSVNARPTLSFVQPTATSFTAPANITFEVAAADADGSVTRVDFEIFGPSGTSATSSDSIAPYTHPATALPPGSYSIRATAWDEREGWRQVWFSFSVTTNPSPVVSLTSPTQNQLIVSPGAIELRATATDNGSIASVEFRHGPGGATLIGNGTAAGGNAYTFNWSGIPVGDYQMIARVRDNDGAVVDSLARTLQVRTNTAPSAPRLVTPWPEPRGFFLDPTIGPEMRYSENSYPVGSLMPLEARFDDAERNISRVEFYRNSISPANLLATVSPTPPPPGQTRVTASAEIAVVPAMDSLSMQTVFAVAFDGEFQVQTASAPVAFYNPSRQAGGCSGTGSTCSPAFHPIPGIFEAERYDTGGAGISYFEKEPFVPRGSSTVNPRGDDVEVRDCGAGGLSSPDCVIGRRSAGEWQNWSLQFSQGGQYRLYTCMRDHPENLSLAGDRGQPLSVSVRFGSGPSSSQTDFAQSGYLAPSDELFAAQTGDVLLSGAPTRACENGVIHSLQLGYTFSPNYRGTMTITVERDNNEEWLSLDWMALVPESQIIGGNTVSLARPVEGQQFVWGSEVNLLADVQTSQQVSTVVFHYREFGTGAGWNFIGGTNSAPFTRTWTPPGSASLGSKSFEIKATAIINNVGSVETVQPTRIEVTTAPSNLPPTATVLQPSAGNVAAGSPLALSASASDPDGQVSRVEFRITRNGAAVGDPIPAANTAGAWRAQWQVPAVAGSYQIIARAYDSATPQLSGDSAPVVVNAQSAPGLAHETPVPVPGSVATGSDGVGSSAGIFRVDETGSATYSIPIATAPGRAGVAPELALSYSSQGGMGAMGRGWSISGASAITRCRQTAEAGDADALQSGSPPLSFDGKDRYCLDGQRLVLMSGSYDPAAPLMEFRTEIDSFARVRAFNTDGRNGPNYFVVQAKDGTTSWYGDRISGTGLPFMAGFAEVQRAEAALRRNQGAGEPTADAPILAFALSRRMDSFGNYIDFRYSTDQANGEQWLSKVEFTGKTALSGQLGGAQATFAYVQFDYVTLPASEIREAWQAGMRSRVSKRLNYVRSYEGMSLIREYRLNYGLSLPRSKESMLTSMQECAGSGSGAVCYPPTRFEWTLAGNSAAGSIPLRAMRAHQDVPRYEKENAKSWQLGDVDGDGRLDVVHFRNVAMGTQLIETLFRDIGSVASGQFPFRAQGVPVYSLRSYRDLSDTWFLHDFNSDGRDDLMLADVYTDPYYNPNDPVQRARSWRIYPSNGRVVDGGKVFNDSGVSPWLDVCPAADLDAADCVPVNSGESAQAQLMDINGDGLSDVVYPSPVSGTNELMIKLGTRINGRPGLSRAYRAVLEQPEDCNSLPGGVEVFCQFAFSSAQSRNGRSPFVFDLNADGRADLWLLANRRVETPCSGGICPDPNAAPDYPTFLSAGSKKQLDAQIALGARLQSARGQTSTSTTSDAWSYTAQVVDRIDDATRQITFRRYATYGMGGSTPSQKQLFPTDVNLDGLSDVLIATRTGGSYGVQLLMNTGAGLVPVGSPLASGGAVTLPEGQFDHLQLVDLNNDGYVDLMYPDGTGSSSTWRIHAGGPAGFGAEESANVQGGVLPDHHRHFFADFDGNGVVEYVRLRHQLTNQSSGEDASYGGLNTSSDPAQGAGKPATQIHRIVNGYGAETRIVYQPLTNSAVYLREPTFAGTAPGRGSPVHDVFGAMYVVASVTSDAPGIDAPSRQSTLYYQYAGAKIQAGGRGMLGFRQVRTIDPNFAGAPARHVVSITDYGLTAGDYENSMTPGLIRHGFPFTGMPRESRQYVVNAAPNATLIQCLGSGATAANAACYSGFGSAAAANGFFAEPVGTLLSYARNRLESVVTQNGVGGERSVFAYIRASFEAKGNPESAGALATLSETVNHFTYNTAWGDLTASDVGISSGASYAGLEALRTDALVRMTETTPEQRCAGNARCVTRVSTVNTYFPSSQPTAANDRDYWRLGRLEKTTVSHWRKGRETQSDSTLTRESRFEYDLGSALRSGVLKVERVAGLSTPSSATAPNGSASELRTVRTHDDFGNVIDSFVCSGDVSDAECSNPSAVLQRPSGSGGLPLTRVHRHSRNVFDASGRYLVKAEAPHHAGNGARDLRAAETVISRNLLGSVTYSTDYNGGYKQATYGEMGRQQTATDASGSQTLSEFHWCSSASGSPVAACPSDLGAVFRQTSYALGGTRSVTYFDKLGREVFALTETFNRYDENSGNDWVGACKTYDNRGRTVAVTEPFFVGNVAFAGLRPELSSAVACGTRASTRTSYDVLDRAMNITLPEHSGFVTAVSEFIYNGLQTTTRNRMSRPTSPFAVPTIVTLDEVKTVDASGQVISVLDAGGMTARYFHDAAGNLVELRRDAGRGDIVSQISYDALGRKTGQVDPDAGAASYAYNAAGELICSQDARGYRTVVDIDALGRAWRSRTLPGGCGSTTGLAQSLSDSAALSLPSAGVDQHASVDLSVYDTAINGFGQVDRQRRLHRVGSRYTGYREVAADQGDFEQISLYDSLGRTREVQTRFKEPNLSGTGLVQRSFTQSTTYDSLGRVATSQDATGGTTENMYSAHGFLRRVRDAALPSLVYWEQLETDMRGQTTLDRRHGNVALTQQRQYSAVTGRLSTIRTGQWANGQISSAVQNLSYVFDPQGNLLSRKDERAGGREEVFVYDTLNRLVEARLSNSSITPQPGLPTLTLSYDKLGNICSKNGQDYGYAGRAGCGLKGYAGSGTSNAALSPHAVTSRGGLSYGYDLAGNMTTTTGGSHGTRTVRFDGAGNADRLSISSQATDFWYAPGGRYLRIEESSDTPAQLTRYLGGVEWTLRSGGTDERKRYIGGFLVLTETGSAQTPTRKYRYLLTDHLGSTDTLVDETGAVRQRLSFDAHGSRRAAESGTGMWTSLLPATLPTDLNPAEAAETTRGFTGHEHIDRMGLVHMNGRLYDPLLGRMISPDPIVQEPYNAQNLNRYSYVLNNPLSYTDPSGLSFVKKYWRAIVAAAITIFAPYLGAWTTTWWGAATIGFVSGTIASGSIQGGLWGAFAGAVFFGIGSGFQEMARVNSMPEGVFGTGLTGPQFAGQVLSHATAGGVISVMQGGKFGHGFASAGISKAGTPATETIRSGLARGVVHTLIGGTVSAASGGKFANGAVTAALAFAFNSSAHSARKKSIAERADELLTEAMRGEVSWPTDHSTVTSGYGLRKHPITGISRLHNGSDIRARLGASIYATQEGVVVQINLDPRGGNQIFVQNFDGSISGYAHVGAESGVVVGSHVTSGQQIAKSDGSGVGTAPHLHYTYRPGSVMNPATLSTPTVDPLTTQLQAVKRPSTP